MVDVEPDRGHYVLTGQQSRTAEECALRETGVTLAELMRRAGTAVADEVLAHFPAMPVVVLTGPGNNGGDGWVAARALKERGTDVLVLALRAPADLTGIAADAAASACEAGVLWEVPSTAPEPGRLEGRVVIDALLGTGSSGELREPLPSWVEATRAAAAVVAVDLPTGVATDDGAVPTVAAAGSERRLRLAVRADLTVTFSAPKRGLVMSPASSFAGHVVVADIGIPESCLEFPGSPMLWSRERYVRALPLPGVDATKFSRGRLLVVAGSVAYAGAAVLTARGAQRAGAGYVRAAVPAPIRPIIQSIAPAVVVDGLPATEDGCFSPDAVTRLLELAERADAIVCGPGLSTGPGPSAVAEALVASDKPLVLDADGLNAFAGRGELLARRSAPTIITPHAGELARLVGTDSADIESDRLAAVTRLSGDSIVVVLKGPATLIAGAGEIVVNPSGSSALATAGTGDVLSGVIGALLVSNRWPLGAATLGAYVHGLAGESAARKLSPLSVTAEDIPREIARAIAGLSAD